MKCSECSNQASVELRYADKVLCARCFRVFFEERVRSTIEGSRLISGNDRIVAALSGGKDSVTLVKVLHEFASERPGVELVALTVDEGVRGYREKTLESASMICRELGVEHHVCSMEEEFGWTLDGICEATGGRIPACSFCGVLRRRLLNDMARKLSATKIATGHNLDDEIQTAFMNFVRGDVGRIARLGARVGVVSDSRFVPRIKPLRSCPEREVALYAVLNRLPVAFAECPYSVRAFRVVVRDLLNGLEEERPGSKLRLLETTDRLVSLLRGSAEHGSVGSCVSCGEPASVAKCRVCQMVEELSRRRRR